LIALRKSKVIMPFEIPLGVSKGIFYCGGGGRRESIGNSEW